MLSQRSNIAINIMIIAITSLPSLPNTAEFDEHWIHLHTHTQMTLTYVQMASSSYLAVKYS